MYIDAIFVKSVNFCKTVNRSRLILMNCGQQLFHT